MNRFFNKRLVMMFGMTVLMLFSSGTFSYGENLDSVRKAIRDKGKHWVAGDTVNSLTPAYAPEYAKGRRGGGLIKPRLTGTEPVLAPSTSLTALPAAFDWSTGGSFNDARNYVTPVRNQGNCGSCWAFATAGALESYTLIQGGDSTCYLGACDLSEQMVITCSGAGSCNGGGIATSSDYIRDTGIATEVADPYNISSTICAPASYWATQAHKVDSWAYVATSSPTVDGIKSALVSTGPLVTTMAIYQDFYSYYRGGVYSYTSGSLVGYHAILIVGYQDDLTYPGGGYFRVKNSWGSSWGEAGFFRIAYSELNSVVKFGNYTIAYQSVARAGIPIAPSNAVATSASSGQINISWSDNTYNEDGFKIERCEGYGCTSFAQIAIVGPNIITYTNTGLKAGITYTYRVRAYNSAGNSGYANTAYATTFPPPSPPAAPSGLMISGVYRNQINISWIDTAVNEDGFVVERCSGGNCINFQQLATLTANSRTYINKNLRKGTYSYRVRAYNAGGYSAYSNTAVGTTY